MDYFSCSLGAVADFPPPIQMDASFSFAGPDTFFTGFMVRKSNYRVAAGVWRIDLMQLPTRKTLGLRSKMLAAVVCMTSGLASGEELISGKIMNHFQDTKTWHLVDEVSISEEEPGNLTSSPAERGKILLNSETRVKGLPYLLTKESYSDVELSLEFMVPKRSNAGIYLMGRYEVQILDSHGKKKVSFGDLGGIYEEWKKGGIEVGDRPLFPGKAPLVNAAKEPGEWQRLDIHFRAPRFDRSGKKVEDALFLSVHVNGELVQEKVSVPGPTVSNPVKGEAETGPIAIQGDHGAVAIRSFVVKPLPRDQ
ncbi:3-keto-disaccharide hydrolase [Haloferula sp.]|uniref:3-keto-disaccharide hydrolase n=1 Tax=Haloferula sp. TaxID=2497595 RepID=UPI00329B0FF2